MGSLPVQRCPEPPKSSLGDLRTGDYLHRIYRLELTDFDFQLLEKSLDLSASVDEGRNREGRGRKVAGLPSCSGVYACMF